MSDACYTARATIKAHVLTAIGELNLPTADGQYLHDAIMSFVVAVQRVLKSTFNPAEPGHGMEMLLCSSRDAHNPSALAAIKSTDAATPKSVMTDSVAAAKASPSIITYTPQGIKLRSCHHCRRCIRYG